MSTDVVNDEIQAFYEFLRQRISNGPAITPEECVREFRAFQQELQRARAELQKSHEEFLQGKAMPLDVDALMERVGARLAQRGSVQ